MLQQSSVTFVNFQIVPVLVKHVAINIYVDRRQPYSSMLY